MRTGSKAGVNQLDTDAIEITPEQQANYRPVTFGRLEVAGLTRLHCPFTINEVLYSSWQGRKLTLSFCSFSATAGVGFSAGILYRNWTTTCDAYTSLIPMVHTADRSEFRWQSGCGARKDLRPLAEFTQGARCILGGQKRVGHIQ